MNGVDNDSDSDDSDSEDSRADSRNKDPDGSAINEIRTVIMSGAEPGACTPHVFRSWMPIVRKRAPRMCEPCLKMLEVKEALYHRAIFERLPSLLGVEMDGWCKKK